MKRIIKNIIVTLLAIFCASAVCESINIFGQLNNSSINHLPFDLASILRERLIFVLSSLSLALLVLFIMVISTKEA